LVKHKAFFVFRKEEGRVIDPIVLLMTIMPIFCIFPVKVWGGKVEKLTVNIPIFFKCAQ